VVRLHGELLSDSPIAKLGEPFMKRFYYSSLVKARLFFCDLFYYRHTCVGFVSYTNDPLNFLSKGLKYNFMRLCFIILQTIINKPSLVKTVLSVLQDMLKRKTISSHQNEIVWGEILSFGLTKEGVNIIDKKTRKKAPQLLFERAIEYFRKECIKKFRLAVLKDNKEALLFYLSYGGKIIDNQYGEGKCYRLEFSV
jgi:hypothetical protein